MADTSNIVLQVIEIFEKDEDLMARVAARLKIQLTNVTLAFIKEFIRSDPEFALTAAKKLLKENITDEDRKLIRKHLPEDLLKACEQQLEITL